MNAFELYNGTEENTLNVCRHCLKELETINGKQEIIDVKQIATKCEWCGKITNKIFEI